VLWCSVRQLAAIFRTCYRPDESGLLRGINTSLGCRTWTNADNFTALYCFCDTDLCNAATANTRLHFGFTRADTATVTLAAAILVYIHVVDVYGR